MSQMIDIGKKMYFCNSGQELGRLNLIAVGEGKTEWIKALIF